MLRAFTSRMLKTQKKKKNILATHPTKNILQMCLDTAYFAENWKHVANNFKIRLNSAHMVPAKMNKLFTQLNVETCTMRSGWTAWTDKHMHSAQWLNCMNGQNA